MVKYKLDRGELSIALAVKVIADACRAARGMHPGQAAWSYKAKVAGLLPAAARELGESWEPGELAELDDWARCGAYLGAIDGRACAPMRMRQPGGLAQAVYSAAYSASYCVAAQHSTRTPAHQPAKGGSHGH